LKAAIYNRYGPPDVVHIGDVAEPAPKEDEVLIQVRAASINPLDWHFMRGTPYFVRLMTGLRKPKVTRLGVDVAGQVQAVGRKVTEFRPGDEVFGTCRGALAEYACTSERALVLKPENVTFEQAASAPLAAYTALQGLRDKGKLQAGQKVLINGAAGGVGTFAVQIAKWLGADVTGVCSTRNLEMVRKIGADRTVDYTREDFTTSGQRYDLIFDVVGNHSPPAFRRALNPRGIYIGAGGGGLEVHWLKVLAGLIQALLLSLFASQKFVPFLARANKKDLTTIYELLKGGTVTPVIDKRFPLREVPEAIRYLEQGHARGKVVISLE
jgi:NADPH:quinone reductase-like Zn-dependent oxidoreductase